MSISGCGKKGPPLPPESRVPEIVENFTIEGRGNGFILSWDMPDKNNDGSKLTDLAGFKLYRRAGDNCINCPDDFPIYMDIDLDATEGINVEGRKVKFIDVELEKEKSYYYRVAPYNKGGYFGDFSEVLKGQWLTPPPPPEKISGSASDKTVSISWEASPELEDYGFRIYRRKADGEYPSKPVNDKIINTYTYTDIGLDNNRQYFYRVKSVIDTEGTFIEGRASVELMLVPIDLMPPVTPTGLSVVAGMERINLYWDESNDYDLMGYNIYRQGGKAGEMMKLNSGPILRSHYVDSDVTRGGRYQYSISSVDNSPQRNESPLSQKIIASVPE